MGTASTEERNPTKPAMRPEHPEGFRFQQLLQPWASSSCQAHRSPKLYLVPGELGRP